MQNKLKTFLLILILNFKLEFFASSYSFGDNPTNKYVKEWKLEKLMPSEINDTDDLIIKQKEIIASIKTVFDFAVKSEIIKQISNLIVKIDIQIETKSNSFYEMSTDFKNTLKTAHSTDSKNKQKNPEELKLISNIKNKFNEIKNKNNKIQDELQKKYQEIRELIITLVQSQQTDNKITEKIYNLTKEFIDQKDLLDDIYFDLETLKKSLDYIEDKSKIKKLQEERDKEKKKKDIKIKEKKDKKAQERREKIEKQSKKQKK